MKLSLVDLSAEATTFNRVQIPFSGKFSHGANICSWADYSKNKNHENLNKINNYTNCPRGCDFTAELGMKKSSEVFGGVSVNLHP